MAVSIGFFTRFHHLLRSPPCRSPAPLRARSLSRRAPGHHDRRCFPRAAPTKEFSTGSLVASGKTTIQVNGKPVTVQIGMNLTIIGSKELPQDQAA